MPTTKQFGVGFDAATTPLDGTETLSIVQGGITVDATTQDIADLGGGGSTPTGTGFTHITAGAQDAAAKLVDTADINDDQVTNTKLANMATATIKGRSTAGTGDPEDLTAAQVATIAQGDGLTVDLAGYRGIPQVSFSANTTVAASHNGKHLYHPASDANARTVTIDANGTLALPIGFAFSVINDTSQVVSIAITTDTLVLSPGGTTGTRSLAQYGMATAVKVTATRWLISGTGLT